MPKRLKQHNHFTAGALLLVSLVMTAGHLGAQETGEPVTIGQTFRIESKILKETRSIQVYLPRNYENSGEKYPVLYILDSRRNFHFTTGLVRGLSGSSKMPRMIVIGIVNTNRMRDMTPTKSTTSYFGNDDPRLRHSGSAGHFLEFIEKELVPYVNGKYRTAPYNILLGHSMAGMLALHALVEKTGLFRAYIAISPALWWDNNVMTRKVKDFLASKPVLKGRRLYFSVSDEGGGYQKSIGALKTVLEQQAPPDFSWTYDWFKEENHGSTSLKGSYNGLSFIFGGWRPPGIMGMKPEKIEAHYQKLTREYGFSVPFPMGMLNAMGYMAMQEKRYRDAVDVYAYCIKREPENSRFYRQLAEAYRRLGQPDQAAKYDGIAQKIEDKRLGSPSRTGFIFPVPF